jgi:excisionase family DNA binding protein
MLSDPEEIAPERSLLIEQAAELLGVSRRTIYYRIRDGRLRTIRTRCHSQRILLSSIFELLQHMRDAKTSGRRDRQPPAPTAAEAQLTAQDAGV